MPSLILILLYFLALVFIRRRWPRRFVDALMPGLFAALVVAFFWRLVAGDVYMPADGGDLGSFLYPTYYFVQQSLRAGVWPLWNPHLYSGVPFAAEMQSGIFYPPHLLRFLLGPTLTYRDMEWLVMGHIWWAGLTTYALGRGLGFTRPAAIVAGVAFMFSDLFIIHFGNLNLIGVTAWIPLALLGVHRYLEGGSLRWVLGAGLALGIGSLLGHIQMTLFGLMAMGLWVVGWVLLTRRGWTRPWPRGLVALVVPTLITLGIIAPLLLPGLEVAQFTERSQWTYAQTVGYSLSPAQLIGLVIPGFFGRSPGMHWGLWPRVEMGYIGVFTLILAMMGVLLRRDRLTWLLVGLGVVALAFSLGIYSVVHGWFTWLLPGLDQLRAPSRFIFLFDLALALLAGRGLQAMMDPWDVQDVRLVWGVWRFLRTLLIITLAVGVPLTYALLLLTKNQEPDLFLRSSIITIAVMHFLLLLVAGMALFFARLQGWMRGGMFAVLSIGLIFVDLATLGAYNDISETDPTRNFTRPAILNFLKQDPDLYRIDARTDIDAFWQPDAALVHGLYDVWGVANPLSLTHYQRYWNTMGSRSTDLYALLNVKYLLGKKDVVLDWDVWELAFDGDPDLNVYRNRRFQPRVHLVGKTRVVPDQEAAFRALGDPTVQPLVEVILEEGQALDGPGGHAQVLRWGTNDILIQTQSDAPGVLLVAQVWYPGWEARVDGGPWQPVLRANAAFQGVLLPPGEHEVALRFRSPRQVWGMGMALITLLLVALAWHRARPRTDTTTKLHPETS
ncbi:MAG TPA: hypothetical protein ENK60_01350 [Anaerolineae bacterium]|nr:hypothetical protein [Anaerolineae bacterium]